MFWRLLVSLGLWNNPEYMYILRKETRTMRDLVILETSCILLGVQIPSALCTIVSLYASENSLHLPCSPSASAPAGLGTCSHSRVMLQSGAFSLLQQTTSSVTKKLEEDTVA